MVSAVTISFAFVFEPAEIDIMDKNPQQKHENIIKAYDVFRVLYVAILIAGLGLIVNQYLISMGVSQNIASTVTLNIIVFGKIFYLFNVRTAGRAISKNLFSNKVAFIVVGILLAFQMVITYVPYMQGIFRTGSIKFSEWLYPLCCGLIIFTVVEIEKCLKFKISGYKQ